MFGEKTFQQEAWELSKIVHDYLVRNYGNNCIRFQKDWLYRNGPKQTRKKEKLDAALGMLMHNGSVIMENYVTPITYRLTRKFIAENSLSYYGTEILY